MCLYVSLARLAFSLDADLAGRGRWTQRPNRRTSRPSRCPPGPFWPSAPAPLVAPWFIKRWGTGRTATAATLAQALATLPLALVPHWAVAGVGRSGIASFSSITYAALGIYQMEIVAPRWRPTMAGATNMASGLSWALLSVAGGYTIASAGYPTLFIAGALCTALGALVLYAHHRTRVAPSDA